MTEGVVWLAKIETERDQIGRNEITVICQVAEVKASFGMS